MLKAALVLMLLHTPWNMFAAVCDLNLCATGARQLQRRAGHQGVAAAVWRKHCSGRGISGQRRDRLLHTAARAEQAQVCWPT
jgi:hypothetical protein